MTRRCLTLCRLDYFILFFFLLCLFSFSRPSCLRAETCERWNGFTQLTAFWKVFCRGEHANMIKALNIWHFNSRKTNALSLSRSRTLCCQSVVTTQHSTPWAIHRVWSETALNCTETLISRINQCVVLPYTHPFSAENALSPFGGHQN